MAPFWFDVSISTEMSILRSPRWEELSDKITLLGFWQSEEVSFRTD